MAKPAYRRVIVKISGEALSGPAEFRRSISRPLRPHRRRISSPAASSASEVGVVVGGGNFLRGAQTVRARALARETGGGRHGYVGDRDERARAGGRDCRGAAAPARTLSAISMPQVCESYSRQRAIKHFAEGHIVLFAGGTGNPYFTTDTTAVLRGVEMECDAVLKATNVDGVYSADPKKDPKAKRFERLTHKEAIDARPQGHGRYGLCACPREPYAYHRVLDPAKKAAGGSRAAWRGTVRGRPSSAPQSGIPRGRP